MSVKPIVRSMPSIICSTKNFMWCPQKWMPKSVYSTKLDCSSSSPPLSPTLLFSSQNLKNLALLKSLNLHQISLQQIEKSFLRLLVLLHALILVVLVLVLIVLVLLLLLFVLLVLVLVLVLLLLLLPLLTLSSQFPTNLLQPSSNP